MPDFYAKTFLRETRNAIVDAMPDPFKGKMFGVWTTDGEPPTFDGMTPVNFTVDNSIIPCRAHMCKCCTTIVYIISSDVFMRMTASNQDFYIITEVTSIPIYDCSLSKSRVAHHENGNLTYFAKLNHIVNCLLNHNHNLLTILI